MIKKLLTFTIAIGTLMASAIDTPYGFTIAPEALNALPLMEIASFDHAALLAEDAVREEHGGRSRTGKIAFNTDLDQTNCGSWTVLENGDKVWMFRFKTANALAVNVYFDNLYLPQGSSLFLYPTDRSMVEGPFTTNDCNNHGRFGTGEVFGDEAILEYYQPAGVISEANIGLYGFGHLYNYVHDYRSEMRGGGSAACEVDVNCPEGSEWTKERDAVVRLTLVDGGDQFLCSGSMVNTTAMDCRNYLLTAFHCCVGISDADLLLCVVRFNYERSLCGTGSAPTRNRTGVIKHADSNDGGGDTGSDFALFEVEDAIPSNWPVYYAGWDASGTTPQSGVGIHHPSGDIKKISTTDGFVTSGWGASNTHWRLQWIETTTNWGVTEGGSSGSPVFDQDHRIVGQLTGGGSCCTTNGCGQGTGPTADDYYGKMSKNWSGNPNATNQKLKVWLDPIGILNANTDLTLDGTYKDENQTLPCTAPVGVSELLAFNDVNIFPSIADDKLTIATTLFREINEVRVYDSAGALIDILKLSDVQTSLNLEKYTSGFYYITFNHKNGTHLTKKFSVAHS